MLPNDPHLIFEGQLSANDTVGIHLFTIIKVCLKIHSPSVCPTLRYIWIKFSQRSPLCLPHSPKISHKVERTSKHTMAVCYRHKRHEIYNPVFNNVNMKICRTEATTVFSDAAVLLHVGVGTGFMYTESCYQSGQGHTVMFDNIFGKRTPRNIDATDYAYGVGAEKETAYFY